MRHQLAHRGLEVVVADGPARDAGRARTDRALVEDQDVRTPAEPAGPQFPAEMPGRGEPVDACADDHIAAVRGDHGPALQIPGNAVDLDVEIVADRHRRVKQVPARSGLIPALDRAGPAMACWMAI